MDDKSLNLYNAITVVLILAIVALFWFCKPYQLAWSLILAILLVIMAVFVNVRKKWPWEGVTILDLVVALVAFCIVGYGWFFIPEQFTWMIIAMILFVLLVELAVRQKWIRG